MVLEANVFFKEKFLNTEWNSSYNLTNGAFLIFEHGKLPCFGLCFLDLVNAEASRDPLATFCWSFYQSDVSDYKGDN